MVLLQIQRGKLLFRIKTQLICTQQISLPPLTQTHLVEAFHESAHSVSEKDRNTFSRIYDKFITIKQKEMVLLTPKYHNEQLELNI